MRYDPIMCMMVDDSVKTHDELSLSQKKQVVTELKGFLKKSYNFSDESEYARAYEDLRHMFTTGSRKSISGLFENAVKKTGTHDSVDVKDSKTIDKAIRSCDRDPYEYETIKNDIDIAARGKASYITKSSLQSRITRGFQTNRLTKEQEEELWNLAKSVKQGGKL